MGKILEKLMKKYWKNAKNTGKVYEKILEKCKKNWKSQGNSSVQKSGNHACGKGGEFEPHCRQVDSAFHPSVGW